MPGNPSEAVDAAERLSAYQRHDLLGEAGEALFGALDGARGEVQEDAADAEFAESAKVCGALKGLPSGMFRHRPDTNTALVLLLGPLPDN